MAKKDYKVKGIIYHIKHDADVIEHIKKQPNQSKYVLDLVRQDMNKLDNDIEELVRKYVNEILKENNVNVNSVNNIRATKQDIAQLLNIG